MRGFFSELSAGEIIANAMAGLALIGTATNFILAHRRERQRATLSQLAEEAQYLFQMKIELDYLWDRISGPLSETVEDTEKLPQLRKQRDDEVDIICESRETILRLANHLTLREFENMKAALKLMLRDKPPLLKSSIRKSGKLLVEHRHREDIHTLIEVSGDLLFRISAKVLLNEPLLPDTPAVVAYRKRKGQADNESRKRTKVGAKQIIRKGS